MKSWKCPNCKRKREYDKYLVMKICFICNYKMEVIDGE